MTLQAFHADLAQRLAAEKPRPLAATGRALLLAFLVFTFLSGLIFTVIPLLTMAGDYLASVVVAPFFRWIDAEPVFGFQLTLCLQLCALAGLIYLLRHWLLLAGVWVAKEALRRWPRRKPQRASVNTDIVAG